MKDQSDVVGPRRARLWRALGPGLVTGAADDDPSGIATYSQAGAQFGYQLAWTLLLTYPLVVAIQAISARIGRTTGLGIAGNMRRRYSRSVVLLTVASLFIANVCNIGADLGAMAEASRLLVPAIPAVAFLTMFALLCASAEIFMQHARYVAVLKWLTLSLFSYFAVLLVVRVPWGEFARGMLWPSPSFNKDFWFMVVAIFGTTISPYLFFWQAAQEVEDTKAALLREPLRSCPAQGPNALARIRLDTLVGMGVSNLVALAIVATTAATLHAHGMQELTSAAQAAEALRPLAGTFAFALFALGIIGTGLLSVPVLADSAAYALGEARQWPVGLARRPKQAKAFYGFIAVATLIGAGINVFSISPVKALVWSAVLNALVSVPVMVFIMQMSNDVRLMGEFRISRTIRLMGWTATGFMAIVSGAFVLSQIF